MEQIENVVILSKAEYRALQKGAKQSQREQPKKLCCSKKVLATCWATTILLTVICVLAFFLTTKDVTPLATVAGFAWGVTAADTAVYSWKAKAENKIKLTNTMVKELADKYGIDAVVSLLGITLSD